MIITLTRPTLTEVVLHGGQELHAWREAHRYPVPGHEYTPQYRRGRWDGTWVPGRWCRAVGPDAWELRCSVGLVERIATDLNISLSVAAAAVPTEVDAFCASVPSAANLHDYQSAALVKALVGGWGRIALATNAGKGAIIALMARFAETHAASPLILCDELAVYDALVVELQRWGGLTPELVRAGRASPPPLGVTTLAMVPTLARRLSGHARAPWHEWLAGQDMVLLDEADKASAPTWRCILKAATNSRWRVGFSGTFPKAAEEPLADLQFTELMGGIIAEVSNSALIGRGVSARPGVELHGFDATAALAAPPPDWWEMTGPARRLLVFERAVVENDARHRAIAALLRADVATAIVVNRVEHGHRLAAAIPGAAFLDGSADHEQRHRTLDAFQRGDVRVLVVTKILDRGTNRLGHAADLIFASGEGSTRQSLQRIGRGLRRAGGKDFLRLVDVVDHVDANGSRWLARASRYLDEASRKRVALYRTEDFDVEIVRSQNNE